MATGHRDELIAFRAFIDQQIASGEPDLSPQECLALWLRERVDAEPCDEAAVLALEEALEEMRAGDLGMPAAEFVAGLRRLSTSTPES